MPELSEATATVLLLALLGGLARVIRGPTAADRMLAAQLFGTTGVAILAVLSQASADQAPLLDVAVVLALLTSVAMVAFVRRSGAAAADRLGEEARRA